MQVEIDTKERKRGLLAMVAAYGSWGLLPLYWKAVQSYSATTILCHRIVWSAGFVALLVAFTGGMAAFRAALKDRRVLRLLCASSLMIAINWVLYIWAVNENRILDTSLGYYINPLVNVFLGVTFLKNRLRPVQWAAIGLAVLGVGQQVVLAGRVPAVALGLALSFALYGLIRNITPVDSLTGLLVETLVLFLPALGWLAFGPSPSGFAPGTPVSTMMLLAGAGFVTAVPLIWFAYGARRLSLVTVGILQYISPSLGFVIGLALYGEQLTRSGWVTFACVWAALAVYTASEVFAMRRETADARALS